MKVGESKAGTRQLRFYALSRVVKSLEVWKRGILKVCKPRCTETMGRACLPQR